MITPSSSSPPPSKRDLLCAGIIVGAHGIRGDVKVKSFLADSKIFASYSPYYNEEGYPQFEIESVKSQQNDNLVISFKGVVDRNQAEILKGKKLMFLRQELPKLDDEEFYHADLIGVNVKTLQKSSIGQVKSVQNFGSGDILEIVLSETLGTHYIPFTKEFVPEVNLREGYVCIDDQYLLSNQEEKTS